MKVVPFTIPVATDNSIHFQEDRLPHFYEHLHRHNETQVTRIIKGEGTLIAGNSMHRFQPGDIFILGANQPHLFKSDPSYFENNKTIHSQNIFFDPNGFIAELFAFPEMKSIKKFVAASAHGMHASSKDYAIFTEYIIKIKNNTSGFRLASFIEMLQVMANSKKWKFLSTESFESVITDTEGLRMNDVYQYTMANYTENISLQQIAAVAFLTPQSFCRYFKKHTSKTYIVFLNEVRVNEACKRFMDMDFSSISQIAYQCGFNNVATFNRVFKNSKGISPGEFIKEYHRKN